MALKGVLRPGYIQIRVTDLEAALTHYVDRFGLHEVSLVPVIRGPVYTGNATIGANGQFVVPVAASAV